jgi:hypothetical protein
MLGVVLASLGGCYLFGSPHISTHSFRKGDKIWQPIRVGPKYLAGLDPAPHDVMQGPGGIQPRLPGHALLNSVFKNPCQFYSETTSPIMGDPGLELFPGGVGPEFAGRFQVLDQQGPFHGDDLVEPPVQVVFSGDMGKNHHPAFGDSLPALIGSGAPS